MDSISAPVIEKWPAPVAVRRQPLRKAQPASAPPPIPPVPPATEEPRGEPHPPYSVDMPMEPEPLPVDIPRLQELGPVPMDVDVSESTEKLLSVAALTNGTNNHFPCPPIPPDESVSVGVARRSGRLRDPQTPKLPTKIKVFLFDIF